jgi:hypothetical protein
MLARTNGPGNALTEWRKPCHREGCRTKRTPCNLPPRIKAKSQVHRCSQFYPVRRAICVQNCEHLCRFVLRRRRPVRGVSAQIQTRAPCAIVLKKKQNAAQPTLQQSKRSKKPMWRQELTGKRQFALILLSLPTSPNPPETTLRRYR